MADFLDYNWLRAIHIIAVIAWMAGLLYLPRLYVYHANVEIGSEVSEQFKIMERRLLRAIMNPAMVVSLVTGALLLGHRDLISGWLHLKLGCIAILIVMHMMMARWRKDFAADRNTRSHKFYRIMNEVPTLLMIVIVIMAVVEPF